MKISVVICAHNPDRGYLSRVLDALRSQKLPKAEWELVLIDNASTEQLRDHFDLSWHPHGRHLREDKLGLTAARLKGITEALGEVIVFVDDDNVVEDSYLTAVSQISDQYSFLGSWGAGLIEPEFEAPPPVRCVPYLKHLSLR